jgi:hypothetical protein
MSHVEYRLHVDYCKTVALGAQESEWPSTLKWAGRAALAPLGVQAST